MEPGECLRTLIAECADRSAYEHPEAMGVLMKRRDLRKHAVKTLHILAIGLVAMAGCSTAVAADPEPPGGGSGQSLAAIILTPIVVENFGAAGRVSGEGAKFIRAIKAEIKIQ